MMSSLSSKDENLVDILMNDVKLNLFLQRDLMPSHRPVEEPDTLLFPILGVNLYGCKSGFTAVVAAATATAVEP
ncbi:hypothetical protein HAX54_015493 [Datura stramonium]|uniref:Uncharacterized protein n=1 Tax=Datura stramonium TaxID=4076 RepID=A0ABS8S1T3_DATST|nr:hypothetical protein [Datura stramonium]